jgi:hypothetical protein
MAFWIVRTYYKKSVEQHEHYVQREGTGRITVKDGYRSCTFRVETEDDNFPEFEFVEVPGGDGKCDSIDMYSCEANNIISSEMIDMFDGGCWGDIEIEGIEDEDEVSELEEFINDNGAYALEDEGDWYLEDTEVYIWGPIEVTNEDDETATRIIIADEDGNVVVFNDEEDEE